MYLKEAAKRYILLLLFFLAFMYINFKMILLSESMEEMNFAQIVIVSSLFITLAIMLLINIYNDNNPKHAKIIFAITVSITYIQMIITLFATVALNSGVMYNGSLKTLSIEEAYYFSIVTFTTLGYGDFSPTDNTRLIFAIEAISGYTFFALSIGLILAILTKKD